MFRRIGWQVLLIGIGLLVVASVLAYASSTYTTEFRPAHGGTYVEAVQGYPQLFNPLLSFYNDAEADVVSLVFSGLTDLDMRGEVVPDLATGWQVDERGITYTFKLNRNVMWHDGYPFSADDVIYTVKLLQDPEFPGPSDIGRLWRAIEVDRVDDYTVRFVLPEPYAPFLDYTTIGILPVHLLERVSAAELAQSDFSKRPVGTGAFRLADVERVSGHVASVRLRRFPRYYGPGSYLDGVSFRFFPTARAALEAYRDGEVEGIARIPVELLPEVLAEPDLQLYSAPTAEMVMLYLNVLVTDTVPFGDTRVRQALMYGLDRQALVDEVLMGQALLPATPLIPGTWAYTTEGVPSYEFDQERALGLLAEAGWQKSDAGMLVDEDGQPLAFSLIVADDPIDYAVAQDIAVQWGTLGLSVTVSSVPPLALSGVLDSRTYEAGLAHLIIPGDPDMYPFWHETQALPGQGQNYSGFRHRRISEVLEQARMVVGREQRLSLYKEFQQLFMQELPAIPLYVPVYTYAVDRRVSGVQLGPLMEPSDRFATLPDWYVLQRRVVGSRFVETAP